MLERCVPANHIPADTDNGVACIINRVLVDSAAKRMAERCQWLCRNVRRNVRAGQPVCSLYARLM